MKSWQSQVQAFKSAINFSCQQSIDVVVAAAGLGGKPFISPEEKPSSLDDDPPEPPGVTAVFDVNAKGVYFTAKLAQYYFGLQPKTPVAKAPSRDKSLVLISSIAGYLELNEIQYTASKWAVRGIFRGIRSMMEDLGYRTNLIAPWVVSHVFAQCFPFWVMYEGSSASSSVFGTEDPPYWSNKRRSLNFVCALTTQANPKRRKIDWKTYRWTHQCPQN